MNKKFFMSIVSMGLLCSLAACGGSPAATTSPSVSEPAAEPSSTSETSATTSAENPEAPGSPDASGSPSAEPEESASAEALPSSIQGRWIFVGDGTQAQECTEAQEGEGTIIEIDATTISSFAWLAELETVEESDADSMQGTFSYQDDSDESMTQSVTLEVQEDGQTLVYTELDEGVDLAPAQYGRCP